MTITDHFVSNYVHSNFKEGLRDSMLSVLIYARRLGVNKLRRLVWAMVLHGTFHKTCERVTG